MDERASIAPERHAGRWHFMSKLGEARYDLFCITSFLLSAVWTYVAREYFSYGPGSEQPKTK
jgi:hypothetical protein